MGARKADCAVDRRAFIAEATTLALIALAPGCASLAMVPVVPEDGRVRLSFLHHPILLEPGGHLRVRPQGWSSPIYVLALEGGGHAAVSPICTHQGCTVDIAGTHLLCPCHGSMYDREGNVVRGPAPASLTRFAVIRTAEGLTLELGEPLDS